MLCVPAGWLDCSSCVAKTCVSRTPSSSFQTFTLRRREYLKQREQRTPSRTFALRRLSQYWQKTPCTSVSEHCNYNVLNVRNWILIDFSLVLKSLVRTVCKRQMNRTYLKLLTTRAFIPHQCFCHMSLTNLSATLWWRSNSSGHGGQSSRARRGWGSNRRRPWRSKPTSKAYKEHVQSFRS